VGSSAGPSPARKMSKLQAAVILATVEGGILPTGMATGMALMSRDSLRLGGLSDAGSAGRDAAALRQAGRPPLQAHGANASESPTANPRQGGSFDTAQGRSESFTSDPSATYQGCNSGRRYGSFPASHIRNAPHPCFRLRSPSFGGQAGHPLPILLQRNRIKGWGGGNGS